MSAEQKNKQAPLVSQGEEISPEDDKENGTNTNKRIKPSPSEDAPGPISERRERILSFAKKNVELTGYSKTDIALYLPRELKALCSLYKIMETILEYNQKRGLSMVFVKYKESIERLFKRRVDMELLEQLNHVSYGAIEFRPLSVSHDGATVSTFAISLVSRIDIDQVAYAHMLRDYKAWLADRGMEMETPRRLHPEFNVTIGRRPLFPGQAPDPPASSATQAHPPATVLPEREDLASLRADAKERVASIYERIRQKEEERKKRYIEQETARNSFDDRVESIFNVSGKQALKLSDIAFQAHGGVSRAEIVQMCRERYEIRDIGGVEYVIRTPRKRP